MKARGALPPRATPKYEHAKRESARPVTPALKCSQRRYIGVVLGDGESAPDSAHRAGVHLADAGLRDPQEGTDV